MPDPLARSAKVLKERAIETPAAAARDPDGASSASPASGGQTSEPLQVTTSSALSDAPIAGVRALVAAERLTGDVAVAEASNHWYDPNHADATGARVCAPLDDERPIADERVAAVLTDPEYYGFFAARPSERELIERAVQSKDIEAIRQIKDFRLATKEQRLEFVDLLVDPERFWMSNADEHALEQIWESFDDEILKIAAESTENRDRWYKSVERGADLYDLPAFAKLRKTFEQDVKDLAQRYLDSNWRFAYQEQARLGLVKGGPAPASLEGAQKAERAQQEELAKIRWLAGQISKVRDAQRALDEIPVGWGIAPGGIGRVWYFDVAQPPPFPADTIDVDEAKEMAAWTDVKRTYDQLNFVIGQYASQSPAVYAALAESSEVKWNPRNIEGVDAAQQERIAEQQRAVDARGPISKLGTQEPRAAREQVRQLLEKLQANISKTHGMLGPAGTLHLELHPIHAQLFTGRVKTKSRIDWHDEFNKAAAQDVVADYEAVQLGVTLGLSGAAAVAFVVSELGSGGLATFLWAGAGVTLAGSQAYGSWVKYAELSTAAGAAASEKTRLLAKEQVDAALVGAVLDSVFVFVDAFGPAVKWGKASLEARSVIRAGARAAAVEGLPKLAGKAASQLTDEELELVARGVRELGAAETMERAGLGSAEDLLEVATRAEPNMATRLREYAERLKAPAYEAASGAVRLGPAELRLRLANLTDVVRKQGLPEAEALVRQAIEELGPKQTLEMAGGWSKLAKTLGKGSPAGWRLMEWRDAIWRDLRQHLGEDKITRTGTQRDFSNDMDMSTLGPGAAENRQKALQFLAGRTGSSVDTMKRLLYADVFTDPTRMHLLDFLPEAERLEIAKQQAFKERELIWGRRLAQAQEAGNKELAEKIEQQARELGFDSGKALAAIGERDVVTLGKEIDALHKEFEAAADVATKKKLAVQIADTQALINATEAAGGGYYTGGAVRRYVSQRAGEKLIASFERAADTKFLDEQYLAAMISQLPELDSAVIKLEKGLAQSSPDAVAAAMKSIGKYGERIVETGGEALQQDVSKLADELLAIAKEAKKGATPALLSADDALRRRVTAALQELDRRSAELIDRVQSQAAVRGTAGAMRQAQQMIELHAKFLRLQEALYRQYVNAGRAVRIGIDVPED